ncbi:MAG: hypothetical protein AB8G86_13480 [Saprospiraceae bacterium]
MIWKRLSANEWKETVYTKEEDSFEVENQKITLQEIYLDIHF